jgi:hypothetical protein
VFETGGFGREPRLKLAEGRTFGGGLPFHGHNMPETGLHVQRGYIPFYLAQKLLTSSWVTAALGMAEPPFMQEAKRACAQVPPLDLNFPPSGVPFC